MAAGLGLGGGDGSGDDGGGSWLGLGVWRLVDLEMLAALVQQVLEYLGALWGLVWVLLLGVVALGPVFLLGLVDQGFH